MISFFDRQRVASRLIVLSTLAAMAFSITGVAGSATITTNEQQIAPARHIDAFYALTMSPKARRARTARTSSRQRKAKQPRAKKAKACKPRKRKPCPAPAQGPVAQPARASTPPSPPTPVAHVNRAPVVVDASYVTDEDTPVALVPDPFINDYDPDGDAVDLIVVEWLSHGYLYPDGTGSVSYGPDQDFNGTDRIRYYLRDASSNSGVATISFNVKAVNDAPVAVDDAIATAVDTAVVVPTTQNDYDVDDDTWSSISYPTLPVHGTVVGQNGTDRYVPEPGFHGLDSYTYSLTDPHGVASSPATVAITVDSAPKPLPDSFEVGQNASRILDVKANDSDPDDQSSELTLSIASGPRSGWLSMVDGKVRYTPSTDFFGNDAFAYTLSDGFFTSQPVTVDIRVIEDQAPIARDDAAQTPNNRPVTINLLANDSDPDGDLLTYAVGDPTNGSVQDNGDGTITYTPNQIFLGTDSFSYTIYDGRGKSSTASVTVNVGLPQLI
ncbi:MAG: Ig-like domain-containing protein [Actinomycetota bacterium]|nr:tandem-95 repeat protein [Actinomycetota bacterium]